MKISPAVDHTAVSAALLPKAHWDHALASAPEGPSSISDPLQLDEPWTSTASPRAPSRPGTANPGCRAPSLGPRKIAFGAVLDPPAERFVWGRMLPLNKPSVLFGPTGAGKSALLSQVVFAVAGGATSLHGLAIRQHGSVLVVTAEDSHEDWVRKAAAVHLGTDVDVEAATERVYVYDLTNGEARLSEGVTVRDRESSRRISRATALQEDIINYAGSIGAVLIVVETASRFVEDEDNASFTALQAALGRIARETGAAVVVTHHATKAASKDNDSSIESARGGGSFVYNARNALTLFPARPEVAKVHSARFASADLFELSHRKSTSSVRHEDARALVRVGTQHGAVFLRPSDVEATPEWTAATKARLERERKAQVEKLCRLYAFVEQLLPIRPSVSPSYLFNECHHELGYPKREVRHLINDALSEGVLVNGQRSRGQTLLLGRDPRKETAQ